MTNNTDIDRLRRLRVLQALFRSSPDPMGEHAILHAVRVDPELSPTIERVRGALHFLAEHGLATVIMVEGSGWIAGRIAPAGAAFITEGANDPELAIYHPSEKPEPVPDNYRGRVSSIATLPSEAKAWLDQELVRRNFTGYIELAELLAEQGYEISKSAVGRYGKKFKEEQRELKQTIEMARALSEVYGDDGAEMNQAITALMQQEVMTIIREGKYSEEIKLPQLIQGVANLNKSNLATLKFQIEQKARRQALEDAATAVEEAAQQRGMTAQDAQFWREQVLGVK